MQSFIFSIIATVLVSLISLIGIFFIFIKTPVLKKITLFLVSFAIGGLLGDAFIHLIPESFKSQNQSLSASLLIILGILIFFAIEKILRWRHCHDPNCHQDSEDSSHSTLINLIGDTVHNLTDGMIIAASFMVSIPLGVTTSLAVVLHEIPQEIGNFGIFIHNGLSISKSLVYNFISALASVLGVILTFLLGQYFINVASFLVPITAGGFIYLAASDLIPELHRHQSRAKHSLLQLFFIILGVALMSLLVFLE
ncbi:MAG: ZIP family metal transporter [Candidatus Shapirobacteria bacterium]|nr:ZIP family metal transporter [Candidatus Shapirobacteria bacterium]MDD4383412.1 ZIP family metal transporter [Candidatus Shapirobacteria bacterium]